MILLVGPSPERSGGIATYQRLLGDALNAQRPDLRWEFFVTDKSGPRVASGLPARLRDGARVAASFRARLAAAPPDLVHVCCGSGWGFREAALLVRLAHAAGSAVVLHLHAAAFAEFWDRNPLDRPLVRSVLSSVEGIGVLSTSFADFYAELGAPPERLHVIRNGVPLPEMDLPPARVASEDDPLRLLVLGSVEPRKGIDELITAVERLRRVRGACVVVDVAGPPATSEAVAEDWRVRGRAVGVRFLGRLPSSEIPDRLAQCDGLLLPSRREGLPFALLEAMAAARPVLAARSGAIEELLQGGAGTLVDPESPGQIAAALVQWVDDPELRLDLAAAGWHRVRRGYTTTHSLETTLAAWTAALGRDPGEAPPARAAQA